MERSFFYSNGDNPFLFAFSIFQGGGGTAPVVINTRYNHVRLFNHPLIALGDGELWESVLDGGYTDPS